MTEQLWAPWRLQYIEKTEKYPGCIFCDFPKEENDTERYIVTRGEHAYLIVNAFPYSNGHLMVVPYSHTATLDTLTDDEMLEVMRLTRIGIRLLKAVYNPHGFNLGVNMGTVAGAGIADHIHWHIVPRWNGDTNFMPVLADVRVIPESLEVCYRRLREALPHVLEGEAD
ncbi:MAG: HIT domain-containing protein [Armatimonadetes bacterium]|nr:HIT domain-containing protein [Armatimonadota bacterium]